MIGSSTGRELPPRWREQAVGGEPGGADTVAARAAALFRDELGPRPPGEAMLTAGLAALHAGDGPARARPRMLVHLRWVLAGGILALSGGTFAGYRALQAWRASAPVIEPLPAAPRPHARPAIQREIPPVVPAAPVPSVPRTTARLEPATHTHAPAPMRRQP
jgi:hypothetical protein